MKILVLDEAKQDMQAAQQAQQIPERRCAVSPSSVARLVKQGITLFVEHGAGKLSGYTDIDLLDAGATLISDVDAALAIADVMAYVNRPSQAHIDKLKEGAIVIGHIDPFFQQSLVEKLASAKLTTLSVEMIPRSSRAQKMDALSSQASLAGYVMVLKAASMLPSILPMMMTPSGTIKPAKVFIIGAGVAGLQAIATAKRLGATVLAYDTRAVVAEQVESLGGKFLKIDIGETGQTKDGYAKELSDEQKNKLQNAQRDAIAESDIVITTAQLFGRKPPVLISKETIALMKPGSVIVDMAAQFGGNVEGSMSGATALVEGVTIIGTGDWSQYVPRAASDMYANNICNLIEEFLDADSLSFTLNLEDEILAASVITHDGKIINDMLNNAYKGK